jgi:hypothetical protein
MECPRKTKKFGGIEEKIPESTQALYSPNFGDRIRDSRECQKTPPKNSHSGKIPRIPPSQKWVRTCEIFMQIDATH